ncbi:MAG: hypothetical protein AAFN93_09330 [Bacteroidota bacterium]
MKNSLPIVLLVFLSATLFSSSAIAQEFDASFEVGVAGLPIYISSQYAGFATTPSFRYNLNDRFSLGMNLFLYRVNNTATQSGVDADGTGFGIIPAVRYYVTSKSKFRVFLEGGVGFGSITYKPSQEGVDNPFFPVARNNSGILIVHAGPAISRDISRRFNIQFMLPFLIVDNLTNNDIAETLYSGLAPTLGVNFKIK